MINTAPVHTKLSFLLATSAAVLLLGQNFGAGDDSLEDIRVHETAQPANSATLNAATPVNAVTVADQTTLEQQQKQQTEGQQLEELTKMCQRDDADACFRLAFIQHESQLPYTARINIRKACRLNLGEACYVYGHFLGAGIGGERLLEESLAAYDHGCDLNDADSCHSIGHAFLTLEYGINDVNSALGAFAKACKLGNSEACEDVETIHRLPNDDNPDKNSAPI